MLVFIAKRLAYMVATMVAVSILVFLLLELSPGNVATKVLGPYSSEEQRQIWLEENGYNRPLYVRYGDWLGRFVTGDLGDSIRFKQPVNDILWDRVANTGILAIAVFLVMVPLSLTLGVLAGMKEGSFQDRAITVVGIGFTSVPEFASAVLVATIFVFWLGILPGTVP